MRFPIKWHKESLANMTEHYQRERKAAEDAMACVLKGEDECRKYAAQIAEAERRGVPAFDSARFAKSNDPAQAGAVATSMEPVVRCLICQKPMPEYEPMFCCSGHECGCMGLPTNPQVCSQRCMTACLDGIGKTMEQRRIDAGIELHTANAQHHAEAGRPIA